MSSMAWSERYMLMIIFSRSCLGADLVFSFFWVFSSRMIRPSLRRTFVASSEIRLITSSTSPAVVSGKYSFFVSILSCIDTIRILYARHRSRKAPSSRMPRTALLSRVRTISSPFFRGVSSLRHWGRSLSLIPSSMTMLSHPNSFIHAMSSSRAL